MKLVVDTSSDRVVKVYTWWVLMRLRFSGFCHRCSVVQQKHISIPQWEFILQVQKSLSADGTKTVQVTRAGRDV